MSLFTATGEQAKVSATKKKLDLKVAYIRLKENESVRVRVLGVTDYVEYLAQGNYNLGIYDQPMIDKLLGYPSPLTVACNSGIEGFDKLYPRKRYIFALYDIDQKMVRFWDCSNAQATKMIGDIEEYAENINEIAFNFKRTGTKTETVYSLNPILKLDATGKEGFDSGEGITVKVADFDAVLVPRSEEQQINALKQAGFPVEKFFANSVEEEPEVNIEEDTDPTGEF